MTVSRTYWLTRATINELLIRDVGFFDEFLLQVWVESSIQLYCHSLRSSKCLSWGTFHVLLSLTPVEDQAKVWSSLDFRLYFSLNHSIIGLYKWKIFNVTNQFNHYITAPLGINRTIDVREALRTIPQLKKAVDQLTHWQHTESYLNLVGFDIVYNMKILLKNTGSIATKPMVVGPATIDVSSLTYSKASNILLSVTVNSDASLGKELTLRLDPLLYKFTSVLELIPSTQLDLWIIGGLFRQTLLNSSLTLPYKTLDVTLDPPIDLATVTTTKSQTTIVNEAATTGGAGGLFVGLIFGAIIDRFIVPKLSSIIKKKVVKPPPPPVPLTVSSAFCIHCGREIPPNSKFCTHCGAKQP